MVDTLNNNNLDGIKRMNENDVSQRTAYIGSGKFGRVFVSKYKEQNVALKIMKHGVSKWMFFNELQTLSSLQGHQCITQLYGYIVSSKLTIVMEYASGITLRDLISYYEIDYHTMLTILRQIVSTMIYIHSKNIVYCDLKPDNIIVDTETNNLKIVDFGLSVRLDPSNTIVKGNACGTPGYIAPEVIFYGTYGLPADIYSFGVLLYVLYTSNPPTNINKMKKILYHQSDRIIYKLFCQCVERHPKKRPTFIEIYKKISDKEKTDEIHLCRCRCISFLMKKIFCCFTWWHQKE